MDPFVLALTDAAITELKQTTVGFKNKNWMVPPAGSHWAKALDLLAQAQKTQPDIYDSATYDSAIYGG